MAIYYEKKLNVGTYMMKQNVVGNTN